MEKARIKVTKSKNGKITCEIKFIDKDKSMHVQGFNHKDALSFNDKEVEVHREKGQIIKILCEGEEIYPSSQSQPKNTKNFNQQKKPKQNTQRENNVPVKPAFAPYNFIPLNDQVVPAEKIPDFDSYQSDRFTGYIDLEIETLTPLYIRDTLNEEEVKLRDENEEQREKKQTKKVYANPDFFSPSGNLCIPGSSLRGMIRTMVEIMSYGNFGFYEDKRLYYRGLADRSSLRKEYQKNMSSFDRNSNKTIYKMSAGYLTKKGLDYFITPAKGFKQIAKNEAKKLIEEIEHNYNNFNFYNVQNGSIVVSGDMANKKRDWFIEEKDESTTSFRLSRRDIQDYKDDTNRNKEVPNLLELAKKKEVPCFYTKYFDAEGKERVSFGHTGMFRLAYKKTIGDHIPQALKSTTIDIAEAIFGNETDFASRIFFEDALCQSSKEEALMGEGTPHILASPKPTTFQHYLEQRDDNLQSHPKNLAHYNSETNIRGYKLYWHKDGKGWEQQNVEEINKHEGQYTKINPVKPKIKFKGRVRFENLSEVELGALLYAIDLPQGLAHKIGMGKPLGLGSIRIRPKLYISDRKNRYSNLLTEWAQPVKENTDRERFKKAFSSYIIKHIKEKVTNLWETERLKELRRMLDFNNKPSNDKTRYMQIEAGKDKENEFKDRKVLPRPSQV